MYKETRIKTYVCNGTKKKKERQTKNNRQNNKKGLSIKTIIKTLLRAYA